MTTLVEAHEIGQWFESRHLNESLRKVTQPIEELAEDLALVIGRDGGEELEVGLRKLLEAKDCFVRARIRSLRVHKPKASSAQEGTAQDVGK